MNITEQRVLLNQLEERSSSLIDKSKKFYADKGKGVLLGSSSTIKGDFVETESQNYEQTDEVSSDLQQELLNLLEQVKQAGSVIQSAFLRIRLQDTAREVADAYFLVTESGAWPNAVISEYQGDREKLVSGENDSLALSRDVVGAREDDTFIPTEISKLPTALTSSFVNREKELRLFENVARDWTCNVFVLVAPGGVGKTTLVRRWLELRRDNSYEGFTRVYAFSFGTLESKADSESFFTDLSDFWGGTVREIWTDRGLSKSSRVRKIAFEIAQEPALIVIDALEFLQSNIFDHELDSESMKIFLLHLASSNRGLCIVTSRNEIKEIGISRSVKQYSLSHLEEYAGIELLRKMGIYGKLEILKEIVTKFDGHTLSLIMVSILLLQQYRGDSSQIAVIDIDLGDIHPYEGERAVRKIYIEIEKNLNAENALNTTILSLCGIFSRRIRVVDLHSIITENKIHGVPKSLRKISLEELRALLAKLREYKVVSYYNTSDEKQDDCVEIHPVISDALRTRARERKEFWRSANQAIYLHYKKVLTPSPDSLKELLPYYLAVIHANQAGLYDDAFNTYIGISKRGRDRGFYSTDLAAVGSFFQRRWDTPRHNLNETQKAYVRNIAGLDLRAVGNLGVALRIVRKSFQSYRTMKNLDDAAKAGGDLSELYLAFGNIQRSIDTAKTALLLIKAENEENTNDGNWRLLRSRVSRLGHSYHQMGNFPKARESFEQAKKYENKFYEDHRLDHIFTVSSYFSVDFILDQIEFAQQVEQDDTISLGQLGIKVTQSMTAKEMFTQWVIELGQFLSQGRNRITESLERALLYLSQARLEMISLFFLELNQLNDTSSASRIDHYSIEETYNEALQLLREEGYYEHLCSGLIQRAIFYTLSKKPILGESDSLEANEISDIIEHKLLKVDAMIASCHVNYINGEYDVVADLTSKIEEEIDTLKYGRRRYNLNYFKQLIRQVSE